MKSQTQPPPSEFWELGTSDKGGGEHKCSSKEQRSLSLCNQNGFTEEGAFKMEFK